VRRTLPPSHNANIHCPPPDRDDDQIPDHDSDHDHDHDDRDLASDFVRDRDCCDRELDRDHGLDRDRDFDPDSTRERVMTQALNLFGLLGQLVRPVRPVDHSGQSHHTPVRVRLDLVGLPLAQELAKSPRIRDPRGRR